MPFCQHKKNTCPLQAPDDTFRDYEHFLSGRRASLCVFEKGSLTLEASLVVPLFLCAVAVLLGLFAFTASQARRERTLMERAQLLAVTAGREMGDDPYIRLSGSQTAKNEFPLIYVPRDISVYQAVVRCWVGYTGESFSEHQGERMVYLTPDGEVCHSDRNCTYLQLSVHQIAFGELSTARNHSGEIYDACEYCGKGSAAGTVYVTDYGGSYHRLRTCSGLKRTIMAVPSSEAGGKRFCSRCGAP